MVINSSSNALLKNSLCIYKTSGGNFVPVRKANELNTATDQYKDKNDALQDAGTFSFFAKDMDEMDNIKALLDESDYDHVRLAPNGPPIASLNYDAGDTDAILKSHGVGSHAILECDACGTMLSAVVSQGTVYKAAFAVAGDSFQTLTELSSPYTCPNCSASIDLIVW